MSDTGFDRTTGAATTPSGRRGEPGRSTSTTPVRSQRSGAGEPASAGPEVAYLDATAGLPLHPAARAALLVALDEGWADPVRLYRDGRRARQLLDAARESVATVLGARPDEVSFTSSGTQALHLALAGTVLGRARTGRRVVVSAVEHSAVLRAADRHEAAGGEVVVVGVDSLGRVDVPQFVAAAEPGTAVACLQAANHEVGTRQPVEPVAAELRVRDVPLLVDAAACLGVAGVPAGWDLLTASAHKWGGPAGVGLLAVRTAVRWRSPQPADEREAGRVPGFPAVPAIVAAAAALEAVTESRASTEPRLQAQVDRLRREVVATVPDAVAVGDAVDRLPHVATFSFLYVDGEALVGELDRAGIAVSSGSACTSDTRRPSHVLAAMGVLTEGNLRISLPPDCPDRHIDRLLAVLPAAVARVRDALGAGGL